jgi:hypothetical protein
MPPFVALQLTMHISVRAHVPLGVKAHMAAPCEHRKKKPCAHAATPDAGSALSDTRSPLSHARDLELMCLTTLVKARTTRYPRADLGFLSEY